MRKMNEQPTKRLAIMKCSKFCDLKKGHKFWHTVFCKGKKNE